MKKTITLLLAIVMTMTLVPFNLYAASTNTLTNSYENLSGKTLLYDRSFTGITLSDLKPADTDVERVRSGIDLRIELKDNAVEGDGFSLRLDNAKWFFRNGVGTGGVTQNDWTANVSTYNTEYNTWDGRKLFHTASNIRNDEVSYELHVSGANDNEATVSFTSEAEKNQYMLIPLVCVTYEDDVEVSIEIFNSSSPVTRTKHIMANLNPNPDPTLYRLTVTSGTGGMTNVSVNGDYPEGTSIKIDATPYNGYTFKNWTSSRGGSFLNSTAASTYFTMPPQNTTITANFQAESSVDGAIITKTPPYSGRYLVAYNPSTSVNTTSSTGVLAIEDELENNIIDEKPADKLPEFTKAIVEKDGETYYEIEFQDKLELPKDVDRMSLLRNEEAAPIEYALGDDYTFYSLDNYTNTYYETYAKYAYNGTYCNVYVERINNTYYISDEQARQIGQEFDTKIRDYVFNNFGSYVSNTSTDTSATDGKIIILLEDIRDYHYYGYSNSYIGGYFNSADLLAPGQTYASGNNRAMLHMDIFPSMLTGSGYDVSLAYGNLAHEFQHLINCTDVLKSPVGTPYNEAWWNEAFSMAAMHGLYGSLDDYIDAFNNDSIVRNGAVLNYENYNDNGNSVGANYGLTYLFSQYLRTQTKPYSGGGDSIFKKVLSSNKHNYQAITEALSSIGYPVTDFAELNRNFRIAMVLKNSSGLYGFQGESAFNSVNYPLYSSTAALTLKGGAAIVKSINTPVTPSGAGANTRFAGFQAGGGLSPTKYAVTVEAGTGGTVNTSGGQFESNTSINLVATPNNNYQFKNWQSSNGGTFGSTTSTSTTFRTPAHSTTVTAVFEAITNRKISSLIVNVPKSFTASQICDAITSTDGSIQKYSVVTFNGSSDVAVTGSLSQTETYYFKVISASGNATEYYKINLY